MRVIDGAVLENESAHARPLAQKCWHVDPGPKYILGGRSTRVRWLPGTLAAVVIFDAAVAQLLVRTESDAKVGVEFAAERRRPGKGPSQPQLVRLQLGKR